MGYKILRHKFFLIFIGVGIMSGIIYAFAARAHRQAGKSEDSLAVAKRGGIEVWFRELGEVEPKTKVDVKSSVTGRVIEIFAKEGEFVKKAQPLAVIQPGRNEAERYLAFQVHSPMAGAVIKRNVEIGDAVVSGLAEFGAGNVLFTVADLSKMIIKLNVNEVDIAKLVLGQKAQIHLDAFPEEVFEGKISFIAPMAHQNEQKVKVFRTEVEIMPGHSRLMPGMTAHVKVLVAQAQQAILAPLEAFFEEDDRWVAYVQGIGKKAAPQKRRVNLGLKNETQAQALSGLREGDQLLLVKPKS